MEEYLGIIGNNKQCPQDEVLAFQVRLQLLVHRTVELRDKQSLDRYKAQVEAPDGCSASRESLPAPFYLKAVEAELQAIRNSIPPELHREGKYLRLKQSARLLTVVLSTGIVMAHALYVEISIYEAIHPVNSDGTSTAQPGATTTAGYERLECHWRSLEAIKAWFELLFSMPPPTLVGFSFPFWAQGMRCLVTLHRLSTCRDPSWDRQAVRDRVDLAVVLDQVAGFIGRARAEIGETTNDTILAQMARVVRNFRDWATTRLGPAAQREEAPHSNTMNTEPGGFSVSGFYDMIPDETEMMMQWFTGENDAWLGSLFQ